MTAESELFCQQTTHIVFFVVPLMSTKVEILGKQTEDLEARLFLPTAVSKVKNESVTLYFSPLITPYCSKVTVRFALVCACIASFPVSPTQ